ncbi:putative adenosine deaminase [Microsporum ferrugineum]
MGDACSEEEALASHFAARDALISKELSLRSGARGPVLYPGDTTFRGSLSPIASRACAIVSQIRKAEHASIWKHDPSRPDKEEGVELYPGMMFGLAKRKLESTDLWKIAKRMPKGALLHCHLGAMVEVDWLFERVLHVEGLHVCASEALDTETARARAVVLFKYVTPRPGASKTSIWSSEYQANTYVPACHAADTFPATGREGFVAWLTDRSVISERESLEHHLGVDEVWRKMAGAFPTLGSLLGYEPVYRLFIRKMLQTLAADGVRWVEIRDVFGSPFAKEGHEVPETGFNYRVAVMGEEIEAFKKTEEGKAFWGGRIIWTALRFLDVESILTSMRNCLQAKKAYPHLIAGFDLVGQEDLGQPLAALAPQVIWFRQQCVSEGLEIPFFFHAGECLGDGDSTDRNLFDAILFNTRRLGHGFSLYKHPHLIELVKQRRIMVESCPISNEVLRLTATVLAHPLPALLARGVSASLSNDDPALLGQGTSGMSHDFWQALQAWENLGLAGLGSLAENSVRYAAFEDESEEHWLKGIDDGYEGDGTRAGRMKLWRDEWEAFCQWIVDEYGE